MYEDVLSVKNNHSSDFCNFEIVRGGWTTVLENKDIPGQVDHGSKHVKIRVVRLNVSHLTH